MRDDDRIAMVKNQSLLRRKPEERLADRSGADVEFSRQHARDKALARLQPSAHQKAADLVVGLLAQAASGQGLEPNHLGVAIGRVVVRH